MLFRCCAIFLLSFSVLQLQIALTRIFSFLVWSFFTYLVISVALLGFGAAGSVLAVRRKNLTPEQFGWCSLLYGLTLILGLRVAVSLQFDPMKLSQNWAESWTLLGYYGALVLPLFFAGACIVGLLSNYREEISTLYCADLLGASAGSLAAVVMIPWLGAPNTVVLGALLAGVAAWLFFATGKTRHPSQIGATLALLILAIWAMLNPPVIYPCPSKEMYGSASPKFGYELMEPGHWGVIARIDVTRPFTSFVPSFGGDISPNFHHENEIRVLYQDGGAPTGFLKSSGDLSQMPYLDHYLQSVTYNLLRQPKVLVIGVGGGIDVMIGLYHGARHVTGVEINPLTYHAVTELYAEYSGNLLRRPEVDMRLDAGRHFLSQSKDTYDLIQLSGVDTQAAASSGSLALVESDLYTMEAIALGWEHLSPEGILCYSQWDLQPPRTSLRLSGMMVESLIQSGVPEAHLHVMVIGGANSCATMLRKVPFTPEESQKIRAWAEERAFLVMYDPHQPGQTIFDGLLRGDPEVRARVRDLYPFELKPATDDRPFFFKYYKWSHLLKNPETQGWAPMHFPLALLTVVLALGQLLVLSILLILLPLKGLAVSRREGLFQALVFFCCLGFGFMFVEIALVQKLSWFLGGPTQSLAFTLFLMLFCSGVGSFVSGRLQLSKKHFLRLGVGIAVVILGMSTMLHFLVPRLAGLSSWAHYLVAAAAVAPTGFLLGMPMPVGLSVLREHAPDWIPWAWAVNSFMTVLGPLVCILLTQVLGFRGVFALAAVIYVSAFGIFRSFLDSRPAE